MLDTIFATKVGMTQAWSKNGKRLAVTKCKVNDNLVLGSRKEKAINIKVDNYHKQDCRIFEIGYGKKKFKNMTKPLREKIKKSGFSIGAKQIKGVKFWEVADESQDQADLKVGVVIKAEQVLEVGDMIKVQGISKGRGFAGVVKRYGFAGGPRTHGQSDRLRAPGSIGSGTDPGRVWKGKKMPGHYGVETKTVTGLIVVHVDPETGEVWINGPVPGFNSSIVKISKVGGKKQIDLDFQASGIGVKEAKKTEVKEEAAPKVEEATEEKKEAKAEPAKAKAEKKEIKKSETK